LTFRLINDWPITPLGGTWADWRECHIKPDLLLIYRKIDDELRLARLGSHSELFG